MRVLMVINNIAAIGGTERVTSHVANLMIESGFEVDILSLYSDGSEIFFPINKTIKQFNLYQQPISLIKQLIPISFSLYKFAKSYDVVVLSDTQLSLVSCLTALKSKAKVISWEHFNSTIVTRFGSRWFGRKLAAWLSDLVVVLTEQDKCSWQKKYWLKNAIIVIPNPSSIALSKQAICEVRNKTVISVGRYTDQKGFDLLISSWAAIDEKVRADWKLKIIGPNGSAKPKLQQQIANLNLTSIELAGTCCDMADEYNNADIYVMSSRYEGFGLTLIEAMSSGLPVIAFDCPMGPLEIIDNQFGLIVEAENVPALTAALSRFLSDADLRFSLSKQALIRAEDFSENKIASLWLETLTNLKTR